MMNKLFQFWAAIVLPFFCLPALGNTRVIISLTGNQQELKQLTNKKIELQKFKSGIYFTIDSANFLNGKAIFTLEEKQETFYRLKINEIGEAIILISPKEKEVYLSGSLQSFVSRDYVFFSSKENQCLLKTKLAETELAQTYFFLLPTIKSAADKSIKYKLDSALIAAQIQYNTKLNRIVEDYPNCYCSSFVIPNLKSPVKTNTKQTIDSFFLLNALDSLHFEDEKVLLLPNLFDMLKGYQKNFVPKTIEGQKTLIDVIFKRSEMNEKVKETLIDYYLQKFAVERQHELISYLLEVNKGVAFDTANPNGLLAKSIQSLMPGNIAFDAVLENEKGKSVSISESFKNAEYGVILFYNHECEHCLELIAQLEKAMKNSAKKIAVYAINTHHEKASWLKFVSEKKLPFTNVFLTKEKGTELSMKYALLSIPAMVITNNKLQIISQFGTVELLNKL